MRSCTVICVPTGASSRSLVRQKPRVWITAPREGTSVPPWRRTAVTVPVSVPFRCAGGNPLSTTSTAPGTLGVLPPRVRV